MTAPKEGEYYWLILYGSRRLIPGRLGFAGWYIIGEPGVLNETAVERVGPKIDPPDGQLDENFRSYAEVKMEMERDG